MIFMIGPIIGGLAISFFDYNPLRSDNHFVGLDNFVRLVQDPVSVSYTHLSTLSIHRGMRILFAARKRESRLETVP